jgi:glutamyl-tRNA reductase
MHILSIGMNHETASVCVREQLAFGEENLKGLLARFAAGEWSDSGLSELVIISTCNRVEIYASSEEHSFTSLERFLTGVHGRPSAGYSQHLYRYRDEQAVDHLFRVTSGLDSLILGEAQILGQVSHAFELARGKGAAGPVLSRLFQSAIFTGKRARSETVIGHNPASIASIAVKLAANCVADLTSAKVAVFGAGEMAELAVEALRKRGAFRLQVVNRTLQHARHLAERWQAEAFTFDALPDVIKSADIIVSSTGAPHTLINHQVVSPAVSQRNGRPLVIIDIAVPRDVEPEVGQLAGVSLYDMDALEERLLDSLASRQLEIPKVEAIIEDEKAIFNEYMSSLDVLPLIAAIHQQAEALRKAELEKTLRRMPHLSEEERLRIEAMTNALVKKILSGPLVRLKEQSSGPRSIHYATLARDLFGLGDTL